MNKIKSFYLKSGVFLLLHYKPLFLLSLLPLLLVSAFAADPEQPKDMWGLADAIIRDVYGQIAGISTALACAMSAVAVIGAKLSGNQQRTTQAWDWLKRIWVAWAVINGIGAFLAFVQPYFNGWDTITPTASPSASANPLLPWLGEW
jgi:hypothetical protein